MTGCLYVRPANVIVICRFFCGGISVSCQVVVVERGGCVARGCVGEARDQLLVRALADILYQAGDSHVVVCDIVHDAVTSSSADDADIASTSSEISDEPAVSSELDTSHHNELSSISNTKAASSQTAVKRRRLGHEQFHNSLR